MKNLPSPHALQLVHSTTKITAFAFLVALVLFPLSPALAVDGTWKVSTGAGVWSATSNWTGNPNPVPGGAGSTVGLNTGNTSTIGVTIDGAVASRTVGTLNIGGSSLWNVVASGGGTLTFDNSGSNAVINIENVSAPTAVSHAIYAPVILNSSLIVNGNDGLRGLSMTGTVSGTGSITKNGPGTLTLANTSNSFAGGFTLNGGAVSSGGVNFVFGSGTLTLNGGTLTNSGGGRFYTNTLVLGGDVNLASGSGSMNYTGTTTLTGTGTNRILTVDTAASLQGVIGDGGGGNGITKKGAGTLTLGTHVTPDGGKNTFSGDFILDEGGIVLGGLAGTNTQFGVGKLIVNGGSISGGGSAQNLANNVTWNSDANINNIGGSATLTYSGTGTLTGNRILTNDATAVYNGVITESGGSWSLTKSGAGTWWFGSGSNSYTGGFKMTAGTVYLGSANSFGSGAVTVDGGTLNLGTFTSTVGAVTINGGTTTQSTASGILSSSAGFTLTGGTVNAILAGSGGLVKSGTGTATLTSIVGRANTYTGATVISAGTLILAGTASINASSGVTINGGTLANNSTENLTAGLTFTSGKIAGTNWKGTLSGLTIGSGQTISPGNSPGTAATGDQTWAGSGSYVWEINNATGTAGADPGWDLLTGTGTLTLSATSGNKFNINVTSLTLGNLAGDAANFNSASTYQWKIADFANAITTFDASAFNIDTTAFSNSPHGVFRIVRGDNVSITGGDNTQLYLVVPEPTTVGLLGLSLTVLVAFRRRRTA